MKKWYIKEISAMTQISIRMLRHYDKIGLLIPSYRESNGYRCYTEKDLTKLQQIVALKFFGFELMVIKEMLDKHGSFYAHLCAQQKVVKSQQNHLNMVSHVLEETLANMSPSTSLEWNDLIKLIKGYNMSHALREKLKMTWAGKHLTASQFEEYLFLYEQFPEEFAKRDEMIDRINNNKAGDADGKDGEEVAAFFNQLAIKMKEFLTQNLKLSSELMQRIQSGKLTELEVTPEGANWLSKAMLSYWLKRWSGLYERIVQNLQADPAGKEGAELAKVWCSIIDEMTALGSRDFIIGLMLWQDLARQDNEIRTMKTLPTAQEMIKRYNVPLLFNPEAIVWISQAISIHS